MNDCSVQKKKIHALDNLKNTLKFFKIFCYFIPAWLGVWICRNTSILDCNFIALCQASYLTAGYTLSSRCFGLFHVFVIPTSG